MSSKRLRRVFVLALILAVVLGGRWYYIWEYPFGWSHCCDKQLANALRQYADDHDGAFPLGGKTAEGSLGHLFPKYADANLLRGKTVTPAVIERQLHSGDELIPESCGWHYVDGLRQGDDPGLALFWDKAGLGHNGERNPDGGHTVFFVNLRSEYIPGSEWTSFLDNQQKLVAEARTRR
jgi:hypothetical protein